VSWTPPIADAPAHTNGAHAADGPAVIDDAGPAVPLAPVVAVIPPTAAADVPATHAPAPAPVAATAVAAAPQRRRFLHGFPLSAALEVLAVLLVLAFILLRLS
jgi:hypothetical protein